jgi:uncharacterized protein HemX
MGRSLKLGACALVTFACSAAAAWAQVAQATAPAVEAKGGDPLNALWSLLGSGGAAGVLYLWAKSEREERRETSKSLVSLFQADVEHKAAMRERLKGQDDLLAKNLEEVRSLARVLEEVRSLVRRSSPSPSGERGG